jgi:hypothetical protein
LDKVATATTEAAKGKPEEPKKIDVGIVAALAVAFGAVGTAVGYFMGFFQKMEAWQIPLVIIVIMLLISAPSMAIAWLKLRKRNLGPILDANGWAVNARAKMNVPFGGALTGVAALPPGATFGAADEYAEKPSPWPKLLMFAFVVWFIWAFLNDSQGRLYSWTDGKVGTPPLALREQLAKEKLDKAKAGKDKLEKDVIEAATGAAPVAPAAPTTPTEPAK